MSELWLTTNNVCNLLNRNNSTIQRRIVAGAFKVRQVPNPNGGRGGFKYEIALESLPQDAQQRYWQQVRIEQEAAASKQSKRGRPSKAEKQAQEAAKAAKQAEIQ
ncbi:hypothetical protein IJT93_04345, partial [bacterium]|nr:hypothetical protein [bacterium]